jgi:hypothetical protein
MFTYLFYVMSSIRKIYLKYKIKKTDLYYHNKDQSEYNKILDSNFVSQQNKLKCLSEKPIDKYYIISVYFQYYLQKTDSRYHNESH